MENLGNEFAARPSSAVLQRRDSENGSPVPLTKEYVESLEKEITELKSKNRALKQQVEEKPRSAQPGRETQISVHGGQPQDQFIQAHIRS